MADQARRLPVYLLLDCSGSMMGDPIESVKQGVKALVSDLSGDPQALETAYLSVITFDSIAEQVVPLTELLQFQEPDLVAGGPTALGGALNLLMDCIDNEVRKNTDTQKGDWRPLVFILTDGCPTDTEEFELALSKLKNFKVANIIACACGYDPDTALLKRITPSVLSMNGYSGGDFAEFFKWVSSSIKMTSKSVQSSTSGVELPTAPSGFVVIP